MNAKQAAADLLERFEFLFAGYANELRANTQPYQLARLQSVHKDYVYHPADALARETLMEHIGSTPLVAVEFFPYLNDPAVSLGHALTMLAIHDIGELITGDENVFTKSQSKEEVEQKAALKLLDPSFHNLYKDIESQTSPTAKFAKAVDKITPDILDYLTPADITIQRYRHFVGVKPSEIFDLILKHKRPYMLWNSFMTEFHALLLGKTAEKIKRASV